MCLLIFCQITQINTQLHTQVNSLREWGVFERGGLWCSGVARGSWSHGVNPTMDVLSVCYPRLKDFHLFKCALSKMAKRPLAIAAVVFGVVASTPVPCWHVKFILSGQWLQN